MSDADTAGDEPAEERKMRSWDLDGDYTLSAAQAAVLRLENERQDAASRYALDDESDEAAVAFVAAADAVLGMDHICALQDALPHGARLLWPDGSVARLASVDLGGLRVVK